jgi:hypothetical protein
MEEIIPFLKSMLKRAIETNFDDSKQIATLTIKSNYYGILADPKEVLVMFKMFGGLKKEIPMDIIVDNEMKTIKIQVHDPEDFINLKGIMETIWDNAVDIFKSVIAGDFKVIKDIPNIDD